MSKEPGRNDPCPCGSGKKYKYCCLNREQSTFDHGVGTDTHETLEELMQQGYEHKKECQYRKMADCWLKAWKRLKECVESPPRSVRELDNRLSINHLVFSWSQDLKQCLHNAGRNHDKYLQEQIRYVDEFCELFPDTKPSVLKNHRKAAAEACFHLGRVQEGEKRFQAIVDKYPDSPWVYINWGDMYDLYRRNEQVPHDPDRARELYEKARPLLDGNERKAVDNRVHDLKSVTQDNINSKKEEKRMEIELTEEQYDTLLLMIESGNWVINATREDRIDKFDELQSKLYSHAEDVDLEEFVHHNEERNRYHPTEELTQRIMDFVDEYEVDSFWDNLVSRLAERDMHEKYDQETLDDMGTRERIETVQKHEEKYWKEFEENGIERLVIDKSK